MKLITLYSILFLIVFAGCSAKEFSDGTNDIANDISRLFEPTEAKKE